MLATYLSTVPLTKLILIQDSLRHNAQDIFNYLVDTHCKSTNSNYTKHYFVFEGVFDRVRIKLLADETSESGTSKNVKLYDFVSDSRNWQRSNSNDFLEIISSIISNSADGGKNSVIIIDSLVHLIYRYDLPEVYRILNDLTRNQKNILQTITVLHTDLLLLSTINHDEHQTIPQYIEHLATLSMTLIDGTGIDANNSVARSSSRISFVYRKDGGKMIKGIETYRFDGINTNNKRLITEKIPDDIDLTAKQLLAAAIGDGSKNVELLPENMSTFKIGLSDRDKVARDQVVLPYLPKPVVDDNKGDDTGGNIHYMFDSIDDWDEEDPDDDLDI